MQMAAVDRGQMTDGRGCNRGTAAGSGVPAAVIGRVGTASRQ